MQSLSQKALFFSCPNPVQVVSDADSQLAHRIAKNWLLGLIDQTDFSELPHFNLAGFTNVAPELASSICAAIASDNALNSLLARSGDLTNLFAGSDQLLGSSVELLRQMTWREIAARSAFPVDQALAVCDRLAFVCSRFMQAVYMKRAEPFDSGGRRFSTFEVADRDTDCLPRSGQGNLTWQRFQDGHDHLAQQLDRQVMALAPGARLTLARLELDGADRLAKADASGLDELDAGLQRLLQQFIADAECDVFREATACYWLVTTLQTDRFEELLLSIDHDVTDNLRYLGNPMHLSIGVAFAPLHAETADKLIDCAEEHMLTARACGDAVYGFRHLTPAGQHLQAVQGDL